MASGQNPCAASSLLAPLLDGDPRPVVEAARTRVSVHYETGDAMVPVLTVCTPSAVRLPDSLVVRVPPVPGAAFVGRGCFHAAGSAWRPTRWWRPPRPRGLVAPAADRLPSVMPPVGSGAPVLRPTYDGLEPGTLVGAGPGLTPAGDDMLAGALVAAHATGDPRLRSWQRAARRCLSPSRTTVVSRALLQHALDGYATPELAAYLTSLCRGTEMAAATSRLLAVGHTSGAALLTGVIHTLSTRRMRGAA